MLAARHTDTVAQDQREGGFGSLPVTANSCGSQQAELAITRQTVGVSPFGGGGTGTAPHTASSILQTFRDSHTAHGESCTVCRRFGVIYGFVAVAIRAVYPLLCSVFF